MEKIKIMLSSTIEDLPGERDAVKRAFDANDMIELLGADPVNNMARAGNSRNITTQMARDCDLYLLILGGRFGWDIGNGRSATEIEFDAAFRKDPTKILVFLKVGLDVEPRQQDFIDKVCSYYNGYWRPTFTYTHELQQFVLDSFGAWLKERATLGKDLNYLDHFVRLAKQMKPEPTAQVYYRVSQDDVEIEYEFFNQPHQIHFSRDEIYRNFWGCLNDLQNQFEVWLEPGPGGVN